MIGFIGPTKVVPWLQSLQELPRDKFFRSSPYITGWTTVALVWHCLDIPIYGQVALGSTVANRPMHSSRIEY
jgi:hypothetical protein